ncbi:MAG: hypothetical protein ACSLFN_10015 [Candidatus Limnocylindrales bacterium]
MRLVAGLWIIVLVAGCGPTTPTTSPLPSAASAAPSASASRATVPATATSATTPPTSVRVDAALLERLPAQIDGVSLQADAETAVEVADDAALQAQVDAIAIAIYVAPEVSGSTGEYAVATVVHLRPGIFSDTFYRDWRDTFDAGVCEQAGGVSTRAETTIDERRVFIGTCAGGIRTYHVHLENDDVLVSIQGIGERRLGERIIGGLTE